MIARGVHIPLGMSARVLGILFNVSGYLRGCVVVLLAGGRLPHQPPNMSLGQQLTPER